MTRRLAALMSVALMLFGDVSPALAYLKLGVQVDGRQITLKWNGVPRYFISDRGSDGIGPADLQATVASALATWRDVPTASISYESAGFTSSRPLDADGQSTIGFLSRPDLDRVLASTNFIVDDNTGALVESDIFFNETFSWSVAPQGEAGKFDLQSIALHETGHFSGLGHSALGETELVEDGGRRVIAAEAGMFPSAFPPGNISDRSLRADDIAGISDIYPDGGFNDQTGSLSGAVTLDGNGIFGAHVVAFGLGSGKLVGNFTLNDRGQFSMAGLEPGPYVVRVEPLDDADIDGFFDPATNVELDFKPTFADRLVVVPRGGDSGTVTIKVVRK